MNTYTTLGTILLLLLSSACKKTPTAYSQGYGVEYSNEGYRANASFKQDKGPAYPEVTLNGSAGQRIDYHFEWQGTGNPDVKFSAMLSGKEVVNSFSSADAPVYDVYIPDTFSISKGAWFVFNQANAIPGEYKRFWIGPKEANNAPYHSETTANDTVWMQLEHQSLSSGQPARFGFEVVKSMAIPQTDGKGDGSILISKALRKSVYLVP